MKLRDLFSSPVSAGQSEARVLDPDWSKGDWSGGGSSSTYAGVPVSTLSSLQLLTVYGCVRYIADGISTLPLDVLRKRPDGSSDEVKGRLPIWVTNPTSDLDIIEWTGQMLSSLLLAGNAYAVKVWRDAAVSQLIPVDPQKVQPQADGSYIIDGLPYSKLDVLHVRGVMFPGSRVGFSPVEAARQSIAVGMASQEYAARFFSDDASPTGVIEHPGELTPDQARMWAQRWRKNHQGQQHRGLPGVLSGGAQWKPTAVTNEQAQFLESRKFTATEIAAQMFLIDPTEMGLPIDGTSITYANLVDRNTRKVQVTFLPWIVRLEKALSNLLPRPQYVKFNTNGLLRGDTTQRFNAYAIGITNGFVTANEARAFEDWQPLPDLPPEDE